MPQKASFNVHGYSLSNKKSLIQYIKTYKPTCVLVLDNEALASELADLGIPNVILRVTTNDDSLHLKIRSFSEWWNAVKGKYLDKRLIVHFGNEPHTNFPLLSQFSCEGMDILSKDGRRGIFGNFSVGTPEPQDWTSSLKPLLDKIIEYKGQHLLGLHEYFMYSPQESVPYEIGRFRALPKNIPIIFTEFGTDIIQDLVSRFPGRPKLRGFKDQLSYLGQNADRKLLDQFKYIFQTFYADKNVLGVCFFCFGNSGGWDSYNFENYQYLLDNAGELEMQEQVTIKSTSTQGTNRRLGAGTNFGSAGLLTTAVDVIKLQTNGAWVQYHFSDGDYWLNSAYVVEVSKPKTLSLTLYDAPDEDVEKIKAFLQDLPDIAKLLSTYNAEITSAS